MQRIVLVLVGVAALIYIGQFAWSFKVEADRLEREERAEAERIILKRLTKACGDASNPDSSRACALLAGR